MNAEKEEEAEVKTNSEKKEGATSAAKEDTNKEIVKGRGDQDREAVAVDHIEEGRDLHLVQARTLMILEENIEKTKKDIHEEEDQKVAVVAVEVAKDQEVQVGKEATRVIPEIKR